MSSGGGRPGPQPALKHGAGFAELRLRSAFRNAEQLRDFAPESGGSTVQARSLALGRTVLVEWVAEETFAARYKLNLKALALEFARLSPHRMKLME